jgi:DNA-binding transcriptional LysR family regulator
MDTHQLRVFLAVYKHKSFSRASVKLGLKQPTVSIHIKALEKKLGCKLFDRTGQKVIPTAEARILFEHAEAIVEMAEKLEGAMKCSSEDIAGEVVLGASTIPAAYILPVAAAGFRAKHPDVSFRFVSGDSKLICEMIAEHDLIAGVVGARIPISGLSFHPLMQDELVLAGHPKILKSRDITTDTLLKLPFMLREEGSGTRRAMESYFSQNNIDMSDMNVTAILGSTDAVKQAIKAGLGVSIISKIAIADELKRKELTTAVFHEAPMIRNFYVVTHKGRTLPGVYKAFIEHLSR